MVLVLLRNVFPGEAGAAATDHLDRLSADTIDTRMIGAALDAASRNLRTALIRHHTETRTPLPRRLVLCNDPGFKLVMTRLDPPAP